MGKKKSNRTASHETSKPSTNMTTSTTMKVHEGNEAYRAFMDQLTQSNVDEYIDLPTIAVMGDTSSGKSSLLSMISQVELPSNDKLTTRCPIMLQMHKNIEVSASVKVIWKDRPEGTNVDFPMKHVSGETWTNLTDYIAEAQEHIVTKQAKEVARDIVSVEMTGPHCENLTLIDLPGIVRSHGKGESENLSEDIESLLTDYLKNSRCVILAVLPANVDFHNSQIMAEALKVDPETKRTIPVLTKPDLIDDGAEGSVKDVLLGKKTQDFQMGFHMVKGRGQKALDSKTTIEQGLEEESRFFQNTEPWRNVDDKSLFGTKNLRIKLGELQMSLIRSSFNSIVEEIKSQRNDAIEARLKLGSIPQELVEKRSLFRGVKDEYFHTIGPLLFGGHIRNNTTVFKVKPSAAFHNLSGEFKDTLNKSRLARVTDLSVGVDVIAFLEDEEKEVSGKIVYLTEAHAYLQNHIEKKNVSQRHSSNNIWKNDDGVFANNGNGSADKLKAIPRDHVRRNPQWIRDQIKENQPYKLPIFLNTEVFEKIVCDFIQEDWFDPCLEMLQGTSQILRDATETYIKSIDSLQSLPAFRLFLSRKSANIIDQLHESAKKKIVEYVEREYIPYTQNHYLYENISKLRSKRLMDETMMAISVSQFNGQINADATKAAIRNVFERNQGRSLEDHMSEEMQHALNAYGKVALKRFIDTVPMICVEVMQSFPAQINEALSDMMDTEIDRLVVAPPERMRAMKEFEKKIKALDEGIAAITQLY